MAIAATIVWEFRAGSSHNNGGGFKTGATVAAGLNSVYVAFPNPRAANSGIYAVLTGTTTYSIGFSLG